MKSQELVLRLGLLLFLAVIATATFPKVKIQSFEMAKCPYCSQFKLQWNSQVMQAPGVRDIMDMQEFFVGRYSGGEFECLHGPGECVGDLFLLCAHNLTVTHNPWGWWDLAVCMQRDYKNIPDNIPSCTNQTRGMDYAQINACATGSLGVQLFRESIAYGNAQGIYETPTTIVNGKTYVGGPDHPLQTICDAYTGPRPLGCKQAVISI